jgi:hypothetical protein
MPIVWLYMANRDSLLSGMWNRAIAMPSAREITGPLSAPRAELIAEYYKVTDIVQSYDPYFLSIKTWSATLGAGAIGISFTQSSTIPILLTAVLLTLSFWLVEARFKILQLNHLARAGALERYLSSEEGKPSPLIFRSFSEAATANAKFKRWRKVLFWPHVALPHFFFIAIASIAAIWTALAQ